MELRVSVIIPAFNAAAFIGDTLRSALAQTLPAAEVIVVDDGSTDRTCAVVESFGDRVRLVRQANRGGGAARNRGLSLATGNFIAFLDHDDLWEPSKLSRQVEVAIAHPESGLIACEGEVRDAEDGRVLGDRLVHGDLRRALDAAPSGVVTLRTAAPFLGRSPLSCFSHTLIPRWALDRTGPLPAGRGECYDYGCCLRLARCFPVTLHADRLVIRRYRPSARSGRIDRMALNWALMAVPILLRERRRGSVAVRRALKGALALRMRSIPELALASAGAGDRGFARRCLVRLLASRFSLRAAAALLLVSLPRGFSNLIRGGRRRLLSSFRRRAAPAGSGPRS